MLESAIPEHLRVERTLPTSTPAGYVPPFPAYSAQFGKDVASLVMATIGAQFATSDDDDGAAVSKLKTFLESPAEDADSRPAFSEWAAVTDRKGFYNVAAMAYWKSSGAYQRWTVESGFKTWWDSLEAQDQKHGWFLEVFLPTMDRLETVFSDNQVPEGVAHMREGVGGPIQEHVYWGSMRDRLAVAQTDALDGEKAGTRPDQPIATTNVPRRIRVPGKKNLAVIRSGQDWLDTSAEERELYLSTMHPVLVKGMDFLRDHGDEVGCYSCRFMAIVNPVTRKADKDRTFGLAYFDELGSLERWSKDHPTHLQIFGGFIKYAARLNGNVTLRLFHEVLVLRPEQQMFEYISCHPDTGILVTI